MVAVDVSALRSGAYLLRISVAGRMAVKRIAW
jgi:hypothetical protein